MLIKPVDEPAFDAEAFASSFGHGSISAYQDFFGLKSDGVPGPVTTSHMFQPRCGVPDFARTEDDALKASWPNECMKKTFAFVFSGLQGVNAETIRQAIILAATKLNKLSAAKIDLTWDGSINTADIWARSGPLNGGTLAWSFLPNGSCNDRIEQRYDTSNQRWTVDKLAKVLLHEWGHAYGLEHSNDQRDIMYPSIDPNKRLSDYPGPGDVSRMVRFYGEFVPEPGPDPGPPPNDGKQWEKLNELISDVSQLMNEYSSIDGGLSSNGSGISDTFPV